MNTRTAGVISLITFLAALVLIVWLLVSRAQPVGAVRIDSVPRRATPAIPAYTEEGPNAKRLESLDANG